MKNRDKSYKYHIYERKDGSTVVLAMSTYAGKKVKGKAICSPDDTFDEEKGKQLAKLRCAIKIDKKRKKNIIIEKSQLFEISAWVETELRKTAEFERKATEEADHNKAELQALLEVM